MSYSLGQAKLVPGSIHFQTTRTGKVMTLQPLVEEGLPIAPYIEHGSYTTGQPAIMRYGLDPYRGISGDEDEDGPDVEELQQQVESIVAELSLKPELVLGIKGAAAFVGAGAVAGIVGGATKRWWLGGILGTALGFGAWRLIAGAAR